MKRLAIITTHPIQYNAPLFQLLSERKQIEVKVFYTWGQSKETVYDAKFGINRSWDIPLLEGYDAEFVKNISSKPDSNRFRGVINPGLLKQIRNGQFDAVLIYRWSLWSHLKLLQCLGKKPALFFRGDSHFHQSANGLKFLLRKLLLRFVYRKVDKAFVVGTYNKQYMLACGLRNEQLVDAPHAVDLKRFVTDADAHEKQAAIERNTLGIADEAIVFLYAGKFYALKDLDVLIRAFVQLKGTNYRLLLIGQGDLEPALKTMAANDPRILFLPFRNQSEMPVVYRMGDVFVLPSKSETWGLGVNEAMACKRPAIVSDTCGCAPDLVIDGETGFVFQQGNDAGLLSAMKSVTTKEQWSAMGHAAYEHVQGFSLTKLAEAIEQVITQLPGTQQISKTVST